MKKVILLAVMAGLLAGCGGGGGTSTSSTTADQANTNATTPVVAAPIVTAIDGTWKIVQPKYDNILDSIAHMNDPDPTYIRTLYYAKFENGKMRAEYIASTVYIKEGTFSVTGNKLDYTLTYSYYNSDPTYHPTLNTTNNYNPATERAINQPASFTFEISGNTMLWKDSTGATVLTLTK